jgi:hypothetical protein
MEAENAARASLVEIVRADSAAIRLTTRTSLEARFPDAQVSDLIPCGDYSDVQRLDGESEAYYFSTLSITESYARRLFRIEERNPLRLIAETVREESRIYPRPTAARSFQESPFSIAEAEIFELVGRFGPETGTEDIRAHKASNGALYLYSIAHLTQAHAEGLIEYEEIDRWNNP